MDSAYYWLEYEDFTANVALNYYRRSPKRVAEFNFEDETLTMDLISNKIFRNDEEIHHDEDYSMKDPYIDQMKNFINCVETKEEPMNNFEEAVKT